ncbi:MULTISPECIES: ATP-binding protein [Sphingomonas]|uniref:ATP-binding protein n=1 Tax=Sphingomonas TaxID=13687 RepID=UPI000DEF5178|nr:MULTISPECIES: AAA family ATPase [Sphingomonas]
MGEHNGVDIGHIVKVFFIDEETGWVHAKTAEGVNRKFQQSDGVLPEHGDVLFLFDNRYEPAPEGAWTGQNNIAVVRSIQEDARVLIDGWMGLSLTTNPNHVAIEPHNTVEYNEIDGIVRVLSKTPVRPRDFGLEATDILKDYLVAPSANPLTFEEFGGYREVVGRARELIETQLDRREQLAAIGARPVRGILFTGPPGTGKTHLARIIAHESQADFFLISGPSIVSKWVGDTEDNLRKIFEAAAAAENGRAIIFFDEIDSIAERRSGESHEASKRLVAQLLTLMDGFENKDRSVVVIAATNRVESLDPALTRPGRFDWEIQFGLPSLEDRLAILAVGAKQIKTTGDLPLRQLAELSAGWSSAELDSIWAEAALVAAGDDRHSIAGEDLAQGYERVAARPRREQSANDDKEVM